MFSRRYGDLTAIAQRTYCPSHLCHLPARLFGSETGSVDHIDLQAFGGTDLPIAHQRCNSHRGTRDADETLLVLAGTTLKLWYGTAWNLATAGGSVGVADKQFNLGATILAGRATAAVTAARVS
jgi:hypothetical protein